MSEKHFAIDPDKIEEEKKLDGIFVLCGIAVMVQFVRAARHVEPFSAE